jgi:hypothetical protein
MYCNKYNTLIYIYYIYLVTIQVTLALLWSVEKFQALLTVAGETPVPLSALFQVNLSTWVQVCAFC